MISLTASQSWKLLFEYTEYVGTFALNRAAVLETAQISPSVFVHIAHQLKGRPLFPNLSTIRLEGLDTSVHYLPLLGSTCLKDISLKLVSGDPFLEVTVYVFLQNLVSASPGLQSLKLQNVTRVAILNVIVNFQHLHTLEIMRFTPVQNFEQLRALGALASLEYLSLTVEHLAYTRPTQPASSDVFLPSLKRLRIEAPSDVASDFILFITSDYLETFTFHHISTTAANPPQPKPMLPKPIYKKQKKPQGTLPPSGGSMEDDPVKEKVNFLGNLSSRWPQRLKEVTITSSTDLECDLRDVAHLQALGSLDFNGPSIISVQETFNGPYGFRNSLQSLYLSGFHASLALLRTIALSTPVLREMAISIDIDEKPAASGISAIIHPLRSLTIDRRRGSMPSTDSGFEIRGEISLSQSILIARYLNALFPDIRNLTASVREREWENVWKLLNFCQVSRDDEKGRKSIGESLDVS